MGSRPWTTWLVSLIFAATLFVGIVPCAMAAAPMCDDRGASAIAPIPIAIVVPPDMNWEPDPIRACISWSVPGPALVESKRDPDRGPARSAPTGADEGLTLPSGSQLGRPARSRSLLTEDPVLLRPGHYPEVFRPPRASVDF